jgi:hypothetical protein
MSFLANPNLGESLSGWRPLNNNTAVSLHQENDSTLARTTTSYAYARTTQAGGSIAIDFPWPSIGGFDFNGFTGNGDPFSVAVGPWVPESITVIAWTRVRPGAPNFSAQLSLWGLGAAPQPHEYVNFVATQEWQMITISAGNNQQRTQRVEIYLNTTGSDLLIDSVNCF